MDNSSWLLVPVSLGTDLYPTSPKQETGEGDSYFALPVRQFSKKDPTSDPGTDEPTPILSSSPRSYHSTPSSSVSSLVTPSDTPFASTIHFDPIIDRSLLLLTPEEMIRFVESKFASYPCMDETKIQGLRAGLKAAIRQRQAASKASGEHTDLSIRGEVKWSLTAFSVDGGKSETVEALLKDSLAMFMRDCPDSQSYIDRYVEAIESVVRSEAKSEQGEGGLI